MSDLMVDPASIGLGQQAHIPSSRPQESRTDMVRVGVIGYGYWGPNIVRNLQGQKNAQTVMVCDQNPAALARARKTNPTSETVSSPLDILSSPEIDAVAVI